MATLFRLTMHVENAKRSVAQALDELKQLEAEHPPHASLTEISQYLTEASAQLLNITEYGPLEKLYVDWYVENGNTNS